MHIIMYIMHINNTYESECYHFFIGYIVYLHGMKIMCIM